MLRRAMMAGPGPVAQTTLSTTNKAADVVLSNGNIDAEATIAAGGIALSAAGKSTGRHYAECQLMQLGPAHAFAFGLHAGTESLSTYLGGDAASWAAWAVESARSTYTGGAQSNVAAAAAPAINIRARMAVDLDAGRLWLSHFGGAGWIGGGDPAAGTAPTYTFTPTGLYYIALNPYHGAETPASNRNKLRLVRPTDWAPGSLPAGYSVWGS